MVVKMDIALPKQLDKLQPWTTELPPQRCSWLPNEDIARILISFEKHASWLTDSRVHRPENGRIFMFNRKKVQYRKDMYIWKMRRKRKFPREDHVKLKVDGVPCIAATYVHSDVLPSFHRRCYWFIQNPDIILVHYLNYPYQENEEKLAKELTLNRNSQQWCDLTKEDLLQQILPMFANMPWPKLTDLPLTKEMSEVISNHLVERHFEERAQERSTFVELPRMLQPKTGAVQKRSISLPLMNRSKLLQQNISNQGGQIQLPKHLNGNTVIIFNQTSLSKCTVPASPSVNGTPNNVPLLGGESAIVSSSAPTFAFPGPVSGSQNTIIQHNQPCCNTNAPLAPQNTYSAHDSPAVQSQPTTHQLLVPSTTSYPSPDSVSSTNSLHSGYINTLQSFVHPNNKEAARISELPSENTSRDYDVTTSSYGVKDVMVTKCDDGQKEAEQQSSSEFNLDEFDLDSLFKPSAEPLTDTTTSSTHSVVDDLFPEQLLDSGMREADSLLNLTESGSGLPASSAQQHCSQGWEAQKLEAIADYSPDWSYTEGGVKILVTGTWTGNGRYMCSFNNVCVPAAVVQTGVLRCFCPPHSAGHVDLTVTRDGAIISHPVKFEYKLIPSPFGDLTSQWLNLNESSFKMSILERLGRMEERLNSIGGTTQNNTSTYSLHYGLQVLHLDMRNDTSLDASQQSSEFESKLTELCRHVSSAFDQLPGSSTSMENKQRAEMTLLHYAAALGYNNLLRILRMISGSSSNYFVTIECNPRALDQLGCTALMWASAVGHVASAELLHEWDNLTLHLHDVFGRSPEGVASLKGKTQVFNRLLELAEASRAAVDDDTSSLGDSTISSIGETIDSGEDTMETDDNFSVVEANFPAANQVDGIENEFDGDRILSELELAESLLDHERADNQCVAMLAEQIMEAIPDDCAAVRDVETPQPGLTLRSLPSYVNSRCGTQSYDTRQPCGLLRRVCPAPIYHMNWVEFLQLPPRQSEACYHGALEFDSLRLTEHERRQLYIAARIVLGSYRREGVPINSEVIQASILIQRCYRKYERFALSKKMNEAAVLIQSKFRSYQEQKRFQRSRHAAILIQSFYRSYKYTRGGQPSSKQTVKLIEDALRGHMTKKRQHQAARKIQRFLRQCHLRSRIMKDSPVSPLSPLREPHVTGRASIRD